MTPGEAMLAEQRHTYLDRDPDSQWPATDRKLCQHARPLGTCFTACDECRWAQYRPHVMDWEELGDGSVRFCRRCGLSSGTHERGLM